ncbi:MAG: DUF1850 domain-containing protein [Dehalococcoidia bacterium]|nr:DUF1850 domain-containing protein [Dehalococcoidia bacterium]
MWNLELEVGGSPAAQRTFLRGDVRVTVGYVHSVEQTWVEETYIASPGGLRLVHMKWQSSGWGLPSEYDSIVEGFYVKQLDVDVGSELDYWFLPLNRAEVKVNGEVLFLGPDVPSHVVVRSHRVPVAHAVLRDARTAMVTGDN